MVVNMLKYNKVMKIKLIEQLNNYRLEKGLSQAKLGKILGVSHVSISNWFMGKFRPSDIWTYRIKKFLSKRRLK